MLRTCGAVLTYALTDSINSVMTRYRRLQRTSLRRWACSSEQDSCARRNVGGSTPGFEQAGTAAHAFGSLRRANRLTAHGVLALQQSAGNAAVATLLRQATTEAPADASPLKAARFADNERLQRAARNSPPLRLNDVDDAVARMQRAFLDLGFPMTETTKKTGAPDGHYGAETAAAVRRFQEENGVSPPGGHEAGKKTLTKLDEVFQKRDAPIEPTAPMITGVGVRSTTPAIETPDKKVTQPDAAVTATSVESAPETEKEHHAQIEVGGGLEGDLHLKEPPPQPELPFFCDHVKLQVGIKGNIEVIKLGNRVTLLPSVGLGFNVAPLFCGKAPGVEAHVDLLKLKLSEAFELGIITAFEPKDTGLTGWIGKGGISFEAKPFKGVPLKVEAEGTAGVERFPVGNSPIFIWLVSGGIGLKYEFGLFERKK